MRMQATLGMTEPNLTRDPLGTEGEMTPGPDDRNPYDEGDTDNQPQLAPLMGGGFGGGRGAVEDVEETVEQRNERLDSVFGFGAGGPSEFPQF